MANSGDMSYEFHRHFENNFKDFQNKLKDIKNKNNLERGI